MPSAGGESACTGGESASAGGESACTGGESASAGGESALTFLEILGFLIPHNTSELCRILRNLRIPIGSLLE